MSLKKSKRPPRKRRVSASCHKKPRRKELILRGIFLLVTGLLMGKIAVNIVAHLWLENWSGCATGSLLRSVAFLSCIVFLLSVADA